MKKLYLKSEKYSNHSMQSRVSVNNKSYLLLTIKVRKKKTKMFSFSIAATLAKNLTAGQKLLSSQTRIFNLQNNFAHLCSDSAFSSLVMCSTGGNIIQKLPLNTKNYKSLYLH